MTLKKRIVILFLLCSMIPFVSIGIISFYSIDSILSNKVRKGYENNLAQVEMSLENTFSNLNHVSQQLAFEGTIGQQLGQLLSTREPFERSQITEQLKSQLSLVTFTNPNIGLILYHFTSDKSIKFENFPVKDDFDLDKLPLLAQYYGISYYGPHISNSRLDNQYVLSALRKVDLPDRDDVYIYIESGLHLTQNLLDSDQYGNAVSHLILDNNGRIAYTELPDQYRRNEIFADNRGGMMSGSDDANYWFKIKSAQGWSIVSIVSKTKYDMEINRWYVQMAVFSLFFVLIAFGLAVLLWKMLYNPLNKFNKEIKQFNPNSPHTQDATDPTRIPEFDHLLLHLRSMKEQIRDLFREIERKERVRADLEVEKLLYQINPHFLMNSLDTVHWLAVMNGQTEIDKLVLALNKLLHYNLGKLGQTTTIGEEVEALRQYLILQQIRYDFQFDVQILVDEETMNTMIPRFILQPLVENSLYHGLNDDGYIRVQIRKAEQIEIQVQDNGAGMSPETIRQLLDSEQTAQRKAGLGIGMNYVKRMLAAKYGEAARLEIQSEPGEGTTIFMLLPAEEPQGTDEIA
ncbi:sensor histidine kinase [Cohnella suwonensis]|uniref:histidine kinase n=1 Tax=Cohnella suwonensis TaxID=696072 RepID=A0ABW0LV12_9BACL